MEQLQNQNTALKNLLGAACLMFLLSLAVNCYQAYTVQSALSDIIVIKENVDNDLHNLVISYRDTVALDNLPEAEYQKLITDHILPRSSD